MQVPTAHEAETASRQPADDRRAGRRPGIADGQGSPLSDAASPACVPAAGLATSFWSRSRKDTASRACRALTPQHLSLLALRGPDVRQTRTALLQVVPSCPCLTGSAMSARRTTSFHRGQCRPERSGTEGRRTL
ncbi:predicted protein [Streptomyces sp. AA4]|nr:predicted protein [Streptomyces sp. AA4]